MKQLYFGYNLDIMKKLYKEHPKGFIDLTYNNDVKIQGLSEITQFKIDKKRLDKNCKQ
jgi:hypothetical protein